MRTPNLRSERGIALVAAIVALVVIGAIVAGTFFVSTLEQKTAENSLDAAEAYQAAEAGIVKNVADWDTGNNALATDASTTIAQDSTASGTYYNVTISRLNGSLFLLKSVGTRNGTTQSLAMVLRTVTVNPSVTAAVTTKGGASVGGNAGITGDNTTPGGWSGCASAPDMGGIRSDGTIKTNGKPDITGNPPKVQNDTTVTNSLFSTPFAQYKAIATLSLVGGSGAGNYVNFAAQPSATGSPAKCNTGDQNNWGEPLRATQTPYSAYVSQCTTYSPIVYINGNAQLNGNYRGQGILLVDGDLSIAGGFLWVGLVIATGQVKTGNGSSTVTGALMAQNAQIGDSTSFAGNPSVSYSKCAVDYVMNHSAVARPLAMRSWGQVF
jgi:Tfp pilus assembly protein PilX